MYKIVWTRQFNYLFRKKVCQKSESFEFLAHLFPKNVDLITGLNELKKDLENVFCEKVEVNNVDQAVKLLKNLLNQCQLNYITGRTSKSCYLSLVKPELVGSQEQQLIGNYVILFRKKYCKNTTNFCNTFF